MFNRENSQEFHRMVQEASDETKALREKIKELEMENERLRTIPLMSVTGLKRIVGTADMDTLKGISALCRARHMQLLQQAANKFYAGQDVSFTYQGRVWTGIVVKINRKSLSITTHSPVARKWKVSPSLCRSAE